MLLLAHTHKQTHTLTPIYSLSALLGLIFFVMITVSFNLLIEEGKIFRFILNGVQYIWNWLWNRNSLKLLELPGQ